MKQCNFCGQPNNDDANTCCRCGNPLNNGYANGAGNMNNANIGNNGVYNPNVGYNYGMNQPPKKKHTGVMIAIIIAVCLVILLLVVILFGAIGLSVMQKSKEQHMNSLQEQATEEYSYEIDTGTSLDDYYGYDAGASDSESYSNSDSTSDSLASNSFSNDYSVFYLVNDDIVINTIFADATAEANKLDLVLDLTSTLDDAVYVTCTNVKVNNENASTSFRAHLGSATKVDNLSQYLFNEHLVINHNSEVVPSTVELTFEVTHDTTGSVIDTYKCVIKGLDKGNAVVQTEVSDNGEFKGIDSSDDSTCVKGDDKVGYVTLPGTWYTFEDTDGVPDGTLQYSDGKYIITMSAFGSEYDVDKTIDGLEEKAKSYGSQTDTDTIASDSMYCRLLKTKFSDGTSMIVTVFKSDLTDDMIYMSIETIDDTTSYEELAKVATDAFMSHTLASFK